MENVADKRCVRFFMGRCACPSTDSANGIEVPNPIGSPWIFTVTSLSIWMKVEYIYCFKRYRARC